MPWMSIILFFLSYFTSKESGASNTKALVTAGLVGAGSYYVSHETDWGKANLGSFDGVTTPTAGGEPVRSPDGTAKLDSNGKPVVVGSAGTGGAGFWDVLKGWGATGTATVIGTGAVAAGGTSTLNKYLPWILAGLGIYLLSK